MFCDFFKGRDIVLTNSAQYIETEIDLDITKLLKDKLSINIKFVVIDSFGHNAEIYLYCTHLTDLEKINISNLEQRSSIEIEKTLCFDKKVKTRLFDFSVAYVQYLIFRIGDFYYGYGGLNECLLKNINKAEIQTKYTQIFSDQNNNIKLVFKNWFEKRKSIRNLSLSKIQDVIYKTLKQNDSFDLLIKESIIWEITTISKIDKYVEWHG